MKGSTAGATSATRKRPGRKPVDRYHHGNLRAALLAEALRVIQRDGVEHLTLRAVGGKLGVSRSALYRHFSDKQALLAAVAGEGFRTLRLALAEAWERGGRGHPGFEAMGLAYVAFAVEHPSHYRVMFGRFLESCSRDEDLVREAASAFQVLVDSLVEQQRAGLARGDDPMLLAGFVWATVHGIAMLAIDGQLQGAGRDAEALSRYAVGRVRAAVGGDFTSPSRRADTLRLGATGAPRPGQA